MTTIDTPPAPTAASAPVAIERPTGDRLRDGIARLPGRLRHVLALTGGRWAFAWSSYLIMFLPAAFAIAALEAPTGFTTLGSIGVGLIGVGASFVAGGLYVLLFMRRRSVTPAGLPVQVGYWVTAGAALGIARGLCVSAWTDADPEWVLRLIGSIAGAVVWVPASALVQAMLDIRRQRLEEIDAAGRRLQRVRDTASQSLDEQVAALSSAVRTAVEPHIARLSERVAAINSSLTRNVLKNLAADIEKVGSDVVRLTSHRVAEPGSIDSARLARPRIIDDVVLDVLRRPIMWPWVGAMMIIVGTGPEIYRTAGAGTVLLGVVSILASTVILTVVEQRTKRLTDTAAAWVQWSLIAAIAVGVGLVPPLVEGIGPSFEVDTQLTPLFLFAPLVALATVMTSVTVSTRRHTLGLMDELDRRNAELRSIATDAHLHADDVRRRVAALLHGPVQGRLSAAAMLLSLHLGSQSGRSIEDVVDETGKLLREASHDLEGMTEVAAQRESIPELMTRIEGDWKGIVDVSGDYDPAATPFLDADSAIAATVEELLVDMVTNAARHGRARTAQLAVAVVPGGSGRFRLALEVRCHNDGAFAPAAPSEGGLVKALLRSMHGEWLVTGESGSVDSVARIPLRPDVREANTGANADYSI
ncbi:hypothetical protein [Herbiconiux sp. L3-i23]|uniref:hypothetical protein n=1 Tax=Herbiconiux sp. L3-i23 TaxID=2905871 RepID=UPI0020650B8B|nr:hypothetical protein [Herbiconiux sp. L3-i23]BDI23898.1 hypothetical protein L3i23_26740 [Herbiconiux sp. L3-i23]